MLTVLLPLLMQVGPAPGTAPVSPLPQEILDRKDMSDRNPAPQPRAPSVLLGECLSLAKRDATAALTYADGKLPGAQGLDAVHLQHCRGVALSAQDRYLEAADAFVAARDGAAPDHTTYRARLGAMAGNAALAAGDPEAALGAFDQATADAGGKGELAGEIAMDTGRALVAMGSLEDAVEAFAAARAATPYDEQAWLLSATLARRMESLATAQEMIERAAAIDPRNRAVALEAGVIAVLAGRDDAARKSWQSVIEASPDSPEAETARGYVAQLDMPRGDTTP